MDKNQAIEVLTQGVNLAVGGGAFKAAKDVALVSHALEVITKFVSDSDVEKVEAEVIKKK